MSQGNWEVNDEVEVFFPSHYDGDITRAFVKHEGIYYIANGLLSQSEGMMAFLIGSWDGNETYLTVQGHVFHTLSTARQVFNKKTLKIIDKAIAKIEAKQFSNSKLNIRDINSGKKNKRR